MIYTLIKKDSEGNIEKIFSFDSVSAYSETYSGTVSKSPVEFGFDISDHINVENPVFDLNATLSAYSLFNASLEIYWDGDDFVTDNEDGDRSAVHLVAKDNLVQMFLERDTITLLESDTNSFNYDNLNARYEQLTSGFVKQYDNCVITSLGFESNENVQSSAAFVKIKIEQLNIAYVQTTQLTDQEMQKAIVPKIAKTSQNVGTAGTTTITDDSSAKPSSSSVAQKKGDVTNVKNNMPIKNQKVLSQYEDELNATRVATAISNTEGKMGQVTNKGTVFVVEERVVR